MTDGSNYLISIIMPAYQAEGTIKDSINSILNQTYKKWELIIVDDFSNDKTKEISNIFCENDKRIRYQKLEKNYGGPAHPRNVGVKISNGNIIAFCDSDDVWNPFKLEKQLEVFKDHNIEDVLLCSRRIKFTDITSLEFPSIRNKGIKILSRSKVLRSNGIILSSVLVSKNSLIDCNYFDEANELIAVEDYDMWLKMIQIGKKIIFLNDTLIGYRVLSSSLSAIKVKRVEKFRQVYQNYYTRLNVKFFIVFKSYLRVFHYIIIWAFRRFIK